MKTSKGFTLIELIAVITLIALLSLVVIPTIIGLVNKNKPKLDSTTKKLIYSAAENYLDYNQTDYPKGKGVVYCISLASLIEKGFLEENLTDISTGEKYNNNLIVKSEYKNYKYEYEVTETCTEVRIDLSKSYATIDNLKFKKYDGTEKEKIYSNIEYTIEVPVTTHKLNNNEVLSIKVRKGSNYVNFDTSGGTVNSNSTSFSITVPRTAKVGEYVIEVSGDKIDKVTKNFKIYINPIILFMGE